MRIRHLVIQIISVGVTAVSMGTLSAQDFPSKPIRIITSGIGGTSDFAARQIGQGISGPLGQPVIVDNRGTGITHIQTVRQAPPDGYTLLMTAQSMWIGPLLGTVPFDPVVDFAAVTAAVRQHSLLVIHPSLPVKSVKELIALAKARPGELNYSAGGSNGSPSQLAMELFKSMASVNIMRIPFRSSSQETPALLGGEVQVSFGGASSMVPLVKSGKLRALAISSPEPSALFPDVPTVAATLPGYQATGTNAIFAPAKTPEAVIRRLNQEIVRFLNLPDTKARLLQNGVEGAGSPPEQLAVFIRAEMLRMGKVIKDAGIHSD